MINCNDSIVLSPKKRSRRNAIKSSPVKPMLTPENFMKVANSSDCKLFNQGVSCTFQSDPKLLELFKSTKNPSVVVDTHLGIRNSSTQLNINNNQQPINILSPHNFNYYQNPVFIFNCISRIIISYVCMFLCLLQ